MCSYNKEDWVELAKMAEVKFILWMLNMQHAFTYWFTLEDKISPSYWQWYCIKMWLHSGEFSLLFSSSSSNEWTVNRMVLIDIISTDQRVVVWNVMDFSSEMFYCNQIKEKTTKTIIYQVSVTCKCTCTCISSIPTNSNLFFSTISYDCVFIQNFIVPGTHS